MGIPDVVEFEHLGRPGFVNSLRCLIYYFLHGNVRNRKLRGAKDEATEKCEVDPARHLQQRIEIVNWIKTPEPARQAHPTSATKHPQGVHKCRVSHQIKNGVDLLAFGQPCGQIAPFDLASLCPQLRQNIEAFLLSCSRDDLCPRVVSNIERGSA